MAHSKVRVVDGDGESIDWWLVSDWEGLVRGYGQVLMY